MPYTEVLKSGTAMMRASAEAFVPRSQQQLQAQPRVGPEESDHASVSTETEDDPVNLAMRAALGSSMDDSELGMDEDEEEIILWGGRSAVAPKGQSPPGTALGVPPTAHDLLQTLMLDSTPSPDLHPRNSFSGPIGSRNNNSTGSPAAMPQSHSNPSLAPQGSPGLLFGGGDALSGGGSIWAMGRPGSGRSTQRVSPGPIAAAAPPKHTKMDLSSIWAGTPLTAQAQGFGGAFSPQLPPSTSSAMSATTPRQSLSALSGAVPSTSSPTAAAGGFGAIGSGQPWKGSPRQAIIGAGAGANTADHWTTWSSSGAPLGPVPVQAQARGRSGQSGQYPR